MSIAPYLDRPAAIVGTTGSGKTFAAKGAVETLLEEKRRVIIIDPTGAWHGLRSGADGSEEGGFPVLIFGGDHADVPLTEHADGKEIAEALAQREVQAIIDTSEFTGGEKTRFMTPFLETLYAKNRSALHLIVDEADEICPQNTMPEERRLKGIFDKIVRRGRIKGFRPLMITQRPAVLDKSVLSQIGTMVVMKLMSPQDRKAIEDWVKGTADAEQAKEVLGSLQSLPRGEGWIWCPEKDVLERTAFPMIRTFDSGRTPEIGETLVIPALTPVDVEALRDAIAKAAPGVLEPSEPVASKKQIAAAEKRGYERGRTEVYNEGAAALGALMKWTIEQIDDFKAEMTKAFEDAYTSAGISKKIAPSPSGKAAPFDGAIAGSNPAGATKIPVEVTSHGDREPRNLVGMSPSARKIVAQVESAYPMGISLSVAATRAGLSKKSSAYRGYLQQARDSGLIKERADGKFVAVNPPDGPIQKHTIETWKPRLTPSCASMLQVIHDAEQPLTKDIVAELAGISPTSSGLGSGLHKLVQLDLIEFMESDKTYMIGEAFR